MKYLFTLITILFVTTALFAQNTMPKSMYEYSFVNKDFRKKERVEHFHKVNNEFNREYRVVSNNGTIWVLDSTLYYSGDENNEWYPTYRNMVLLRDEYGNMTNAINQSFDVSTQAWINTDTITATYHNAEIQHTYLEKPWNSNTQEWADTSCNKEYDETGNQLKYLGRIWDYSNNEFTWGWKYDLTLNDEGEWLYEIDYEWDNDSQIWNLYTKYNFSYDNNRNLTIITVQSWNSDAEAWINYRQFLYTYDTDGNRTQAFDQSWNSDTEEWIPSRQDLYTYDANGNQTQILIQLWDSETEAWINNVQYLNTYDANGNRTQFIVQSWNSDTEEWNSDWQYLYTYDANGNRTQFTIQSWNSETEEWISDWQRLYTYDANGNRTQYLRQNWDSGTEEWINNRKEDYFWSEFETSNIVNIDNSTITVFPNPVKDILSIKGVENAKISVYTVAGKLLKHTKLHNNQIDMSDLPAGNYLITITNGTNVITKQIVKK